MVLALILTLCSFAIPAKIEPKVTNVGGAHCMAVGLTTPPTDSFGFPMSSVEYIDNGCGYDKKPLPLPTFINYLFWLAIVLGAMKFIKVLRKE